MVHSAESGKHKFDFEYRIIGTKNPGFSKTCIMCLDEEEKGALEKLWGGKVMSEEKSPHS